MSTIEKVWTTTAGLQAAVLIVTCQIEKGGPTYRRHRCGYVAIPSGHQLHGKSYDDDVFCDVDVHGGLTFSGTSGDRPIESIDSSDWLLGFDCAHSGDGMIENCLSTTLLMKRAHWSTASNSASISRNNL